MATLPKTGRIAPAQLDVEQLPQARPPRDPGINVTGPNAATGFAEGLNTLATGAVESLDAREAKFFEMQQRVEKQKLAQTVLESELDFNDLAREQLNAFEKDGKLTKDSFDVEYRQFLDQTIDNKVNDSGLTGLAAEMLRTNLEKSKGNIALQASLVSTKARREKGFKVAGGHLNVFNSNRPSRETFPEYAARLKEFISMRGIDTMLSPDETEMLEGAALGNEFISRLHSTLVSNQKNPIEMAEQFIERHRFDVPDDFLGKAEGMVAEASKSFQSFQVERERRFQRAESAFGVSREEFTQTQRFFAEFGEFPPENAGKQSLKERVAEFEGVTGRKATEDEIKRMEGILEKEKEDTAQSGFTLSAGQSRFDAQGNLIVEGPKAPTPEELGRAEADKKIAYMDALKEAGVSAQGLENDLVDESGNVKTEVEGPLFRQMVTQMGGQVDEDGSAVGISQDKLGMLSGLMADASEKIRTGKAKSISEAVNLVRLEQPSGTFPKDLTFQELAAQRKQEILGGGPQVDVPNNAEQAVKEYNAEVNAAGKIDLGAATGVVSGVIDSWNAVMGNFSPSLEDPEVTQARMNHALVGREFIRILALNPRFAMGEQEMLRSMFPGPSVFNTPEAARNHIGLLDGILDSKVRDYESSLRVRALGPEAHMEALRNLETLYQMKRLINRFDLSPGGKTTVDISANTPIEDVRGMSSADIKKFVGNADDATLNSLPEEHQRIIEEKLGGETTPETTDTPESPTGGQTETQAEAPTEQSPANFSQLFQKLETDQLQKQMERIEQNDPKTERDHQMIASINEVLALRKGSKKKKGKKGKAEPDDRNWFAGSFEKDDTDTVIQVIQRLEGKGSLTKPEKELLEAAKLELEIRGGNAN